MVRSLSPEFRLCAACAMWPPSDHRTETICAVAAGPLDWSRFFRMAKRHRVLGLALDGLKRAQLDVPPDAAKEFGTHAENLLRKYLALAAEALRLQRLFEKAGLPVLFVKGSSLAMLAFGDLGLSGGEDIDLLVPLETLPAATTLVEGAGYRRFDPPPGTSDAQLRLLMPMRRDFGFAHRSSGIPIELHWRLFSNPHAIAQNSIMAASRVVPLTNTMGLRTLGDEDLFAYLCTHGALHWWNRLKWLADVNALLASKPEASVERLVRAAEARGAARAAALALLLCRSLFQTSLPASITATLEKSATVRWLEATALAAMTTGRGERDPHEVRLGTTRGSLSAWLLRRGWRYKLKELNLHLINQADVLTVPLPERLRFLYPLLRLPLWAWRHITKGRDAR